MEFENLSAEQKAKLWEIWQTIKPKQEVKPVEKPKPEVREEPKQKLIYSTYMPLGEGRGIKVNVWPNNLQLTRTERQEDGSWQNTQEIALARPILEKLFIRLPKLFELMKEEEKE
jgi:hypothetical protein